MGIASVEGAAPSVWVCRGALISSRLTGRARAGRAGAAGLVSAPFTVSSASTRARNGWR